MQMVSGPEIEVPSQMNEQLKTALLLGSVSNSVANQLPFLVLNEICEAFKLLFWFEEVEKFTKGIVTFPEGGFVDV